MNHQYNFSTNTGLQSRARTIFSRLSAKYFPNKQPWGLDPNYNPQHLKAE